MTTTPSDLYLALTPLVGNATKIHNRQSHTREHAQAITHEDTKLYMVRQLCVPPQKKISAVILSPLNLVFWSYGCNYITYIDPSVAL